QRGRQRDRLRGAPVHSVIVGGPLGEFVPSAFDAVKTAPERKDFGSQKQQQALEIVESTAMGFLMTESGGQLISRQGEHYLARNQQPRAQYSGESHYPWHAIQNPNQAPSLGAFTALQKAGRPDRGPRAPPNGHCPEDRSDRGGRHKPPTDVFRRTDGF